MKNKASIYTPILLIVLFLFLALSRFLPSEWLGMEKNPYYAVVILQLLIYIMPAVFYSKLRPKGFIKKLRLRFPRTSHVLLILYASVFLICGNILISMGMYNLLPEQFLDTSAANQAAFAMNGGFLGGVYMAVAFAVLPAVTEELIFRGIVVGEYESYGVGFAVVMSSLTFAMSHFSFVRLPIYFFSGIVLAVVVYATRSLLASAIVHSLNNLCVLFLERYIVYIVDKQNISMLLLLIIFALIALVFLTFLCGEASGIYKGYALEMMTVDHGAEKEGGFLPRIASVCFSPTFLLLAVLFITFTITA